MASYAARTDDIGHVIEQMVKLAAERGGRIDYDRRQLVEALRSEEFQRIHWFYYCDDARGNTIRVFDEAFFEKYRHLYREPGHEPPSYVVLRGHDLGTEQEATKQKMRALFGELEKPPRGITAKGDEQCQQWFAERNSGNPVRAQQIAPAPAVGPANEPRTPTPTGRYTSLMEQTFLDATFFARLETLLEKHYQVILEGPPGAGKTFVAEAFGRWWTSPGLSGAAEGSAFELIQFHESYGYEDFFQGIRPVLLDDAGMEIPPHDTTTPPRRMVYRNVPGGFYTLCERARKHQAPNARFVLVIDEINRGKASRIFGELLYLLEYRGEDKVLRLASGQEFSVPKNVYLLGTMNTADRSIALVDYALRRRFKFVPLRPFIPSGAGGPDAPVLRRWLREREVTNAVDIVALFCRLNAKVAEQSEHLIVGHSYFMLPDLQRGHPYPREQLEEVWASSVLPLLSEYRPHLPTAEIEAEYGLDALVAAA